MKRKTLRLIALSLCVVLMAAAVVDTAPVSAYAVTQTEIDALKAERDAIKAQRQEKQAIVEQLEADKASVVEQKQAMDERNMYTLQQIQLNSDEIALYDEMIADKEKELTEAQRLEDEQLERYRARVRAMEENGSVGYLAMVLKTSSLGDFLTAMDDIGEIMQSDKELEDAYIAARENTEEVKADYEAYRADINAKQEVLRAEQAELEKDIEEAINLILDIENDLEKRQAEYDEIMAAEDAANANIGSSPSLKSRGAPSRPITAAAPEAEEQSATAALSGLSRRMSMYRAGSACAFIPLPDSRKRTPV